MTHNTLSSAILYTLIYSDIFNFPLKLDELHKRLTIVKTSKSNLAREINNLLNVNAIEQTDEFFHLPNRSNIVSLRLKREAISKAKKAKATSITNLIIKKIPTIDSVYITGSIAVNNATQHDDIDILIILKPDTLWTTRLMLNTTLAILGIRRTPNQKSVSDKLCLNMFLTTQSLTIPAQQQNIYSAYELIQIHPIFTKSATKQTILNHNTWINKYLPNIDLQSVSTQTYSSNKTKPFLNPITKSIKSIQRVTEKLSFTIQLNYMKSKITNEQVSYNYAYFHPNKLSEKITKKLIQKSVMYNVIPWEKFIRSAT